MSGAAAIRPPAAPQPVNNVRREAIAIEFLKVITKFLVASFEAIQFRAVGFPCGVVGLGAGFPAGDFRVEPAVGFLELPDFRRALATGPSVNDAATEQCASGKRGYAGEHEPASDRSTYE